MAKNKEIPGDNAVCVLLSGGLDSCVLLSELVNKFDRVHPVYIRCGLLWEEAELYWLKKFLSFVKDSLVKELKIIEIRSI